MVSDSDFYKPLTVYFVIASSTERTPRPWSLLQSTSHTFKLAQVHINARYISH